MRSPIRLGLRVQETERRQRKVPNLPLTQLSFHQPWLGAAYWLDIKPAFMALNHCRNFKEEGKPQKEVDGKQHKENGQKVEKATHHRKLLYNTA